MQVQSIEDGKYHHSDKTIELIKQRLTGKTRTDDQKKHYSEAKRGEKSPSARLSARQVREIRQRIISGEPYKNMVDEFSVTWQNIRAISIRKTWRHLRIETGEREYWATKGRYLNERGTWVLIISESTTQEA